MVRHLSVIALLLVLLGLVPTPKLQALSPLPSRASHITAMTTQPDGETIDQSNSSVGLPPLPRSCISVGTPLNYSSPVCCVSGYIYLNGDPVANAIVTVTSAKASVVVTTTLRPGSIKPYFMLSLDVPPLQVQPGEVITLTASAGGQQRSQSFIAHEGGQQVDVVLPQSTVDGTWVIGNQALGARHDFSMAYDAVRQRTIVFGGLNKTYFSWDANNVLGDTWEWDGSTWMLQRTPDGPRPRYGAAMVYDVARRRTILFGGRTGSSSESIYLGDTWEWDGVRWTQRLDVGGISPRSDYVMAYDPLRQRVVLFGRSHGGENTNETWEWDGSQWLQQSPSIIPPSSSGFLGMSYDDIRQRIVLVMTGSNDNIAVWEWDGINWYKRYPPSAPTARRDATIVYNPIRHRLLLTGGRTLTQDTTLSESWEWDGSAWRLLETPFLARYNHRMVYDTARQQIIVVGGAQRDRTGNNQIAWGILDDTWEWDSQEWSQRSPRLSPSRRNNYGLTYDEGRQRTILLGGYAQVPNCGPASMCSIADTWEWDGNTWTNYPRARGPSGRQGTAMAYDSSRQQTILFGGNLGLNTPPYANDTWAWDGTTWTERISITMPPSRTNHLMAYDAHRHRIVLFGGQTSSGNFLTDTWEWDGSAWRITTPIAHPPARYYHSMVYNDMLQKIMLFDSAMNTWLWDGVNWSIFEWGPGMKPSGSQAASYDSLRQRLIMVSIRDSSSTNLETWEWDGSVWTHLTATIQVGSIAPRLVYDKNRHKTILIVTNGGMNTWEWDGLRWEHHPHDKNTIGNGHRPGASLAYEHGGTTIMFGGRVGTLPLEPFTYRWQGNEWRQLITRQNPTGRVGHRMARNADGSRIILFGGQDQGNSYHNDTWSWNGEDWTKVNTPHEPSPRIYPGLTYDTARQVWILFGGSNATNYLSDTWEFDGTTWSERVVSTFPPQRANATMTYDVSRQRTVLIGGQNVDGFLNDVWEWDGITWVDVSPSTRVRARANHGATFDTVNSVVVMMGGISSTGPMSDTWEWNGHFWTQRLLAQAPIPSEWVVMDYDGQRGEIVAIPGTYLHQVLGAVSNPLPIATINRITPRDARWNTDTLLFEGSGSDADGTNTITAYQWYLNDDIVPFSTQPTVNIPANDFPIGPQRIRFRVQDNEGAWSPAIETRIFIRNDHGGINEGPDWTLLLYIVADNNLDFVLGDHAVNQGLLYRLRRSGIQHRVNVGILFDGAGIGDTHLFTLDAMGRWQDEGWPEAEARMDDMTTLQTFIQWGRRRFQSDYYALSLIDHANGVVGLGQDLSSNSDGTAFLTPLEIRSALQAATDDGARKIDVLHYDGCSFGLLENASIAEGLVNYIIASPNTGWGIFAYDYYRFLAKNADSPRMYAERVAESYASAVAANRLPYTITVLDMAQFGAINNAISILGDRLTTYVAYDPVERINILKTIRQQSQLYDSGGLRYLEPDVDDSYVDILSLTTNLRNMITDSQVVIAATEVNDLLTSDIPFVVYERHASASFEHYDPTVGHDRRFHVNLDHAHGLALYYPSRSTTASSSAYVRYVTNQLFPSTSQSGWTRFLTEGLPPPTGWDPSPMPGTVLFEPLLSPTITTHTLYMPLIRR